MKRKYINLILLFLVKFTISICFFAYITVFFNLKFNELRNEILSIALEKEEKKDNFKVILNPNIPTNQYTLQTMIPLDNFDMIKLHEEKEMHFILFYKYVGME